MENLDSCMDSGEIRCICEFTDDDGYTIQCEGCFVWQHAVCVGINKSNEPDHYFCEKCEPRSFDSKRANSIQKKNFNAKSSQAKRQNESKQEDHVSTQKRKGLTEDKKTNRNKKKTVESSSSSSLPIDLVSRAISVTTKNKGLSERTKKPKFSSAGLKDHVEPYVQPESRLLELIPFETIQDNHPSTFFTSDTFPSISTFPELPKSLLNSFVLRASGEPNVCLLVTPYKALALRTPIEVYASLANHSALPICAASQWIPKDTFITEYVGEYSHGALFSPYSIAMNGFSINASKKGNLARFCRRSCKGTVVPQLFKKYGHQLSFGLVAACDISPHTPLTIGWSDAQLCQLQTDASIYSEAAYTLFECVGCPLSQYKQCPLFQTFEKDSSFTVIPVSTVPGYFFPSYSSNKFSGIFSSSNSSLNSSGSVVNIVDVDDEKIHMDYEYEDIDQDPENPSEENTDMNRGYITQQHSTDGMNDIISEDVDIHERLASSLDDDMDDERDSEEPGIDAAKKMENDDGEHEEKTREDIGIEDMAMEDGAEYGDDSVSNRGKKLKTKATHSVVPQQSKKVCELQDETIQLMLTLMDGPDDEGIRLPCISQELILMGEDNPDPDRKWRRQKAFIRLQWKSWALRQAIQLVHKSVHQHVQQEGFFFDILSSYHHGAKHEIAENKPSPAKIVTSKLKIVGEIPKTMHQTIKLSHSFGKSFWKRQNPTPIAHKRFSLSDYKNRFVERSSSVLVKKKQ